MLDNITTLKGRICVFYRYKNNKIQAKCEYNNNSVISMQFDDKQKIIISFEGTYI